jgi:hypothetical protein
VKPTRGFPRKDACSDWSSLAQTGIDQFRIFFPRGILLMQIPEWLSARAGVNFAFGQRRRRRSEVRLQWDSLKGLNIDYRCCID